MLVPLIVLSIGAVAAGFVFHGYFIEPTAGETYWKGVIAFREHLMHSMHEVPTLVKLSATIAMLLGLGTAWYSYIRAPQTPKAAAEALPLLYRWFLRKWYFDELYHLIFVRPAFAIGRLLWHRGDEKTIDRFGPNGSAFVVEIGSRAAARLQSGYVYTYAFVMLIGLTAAVTWAIAR
jgi:NADH-quinone oxidoreductase subunit L